MEAVQCQVLFGLATGRGINLCREQVGPTKPTAEMSASFLQTDSLLQLRLSNAAIRPPMTGIECHEKKNCQATLQI